MPESTHDQDQSGGRVARPRAARTVVVTGASAGVGRATAIRFAREGWRVGLLARGRAGLEGAAGDVRDAGGTAHTVQCDVTDEDAVEAAADEIEDRLGEIDVWVNNAMVTVYGHFVDLEPDEFRRVVDVTFLGSVWGTRAALRRMLPRDRGVVVQVGSALGERGIPIQSAYCASKHALNGFIDSVRSELIDQDSAVDIRVAQMPALNTPQFVWGRNKMDQAPQPMPPIYQPEVAADAVHHLATHPTQRELWVGAPTAFTILGNRVSSAVADHYLGTSGVQSQQTDEPADHDRDNLFEPLDEQQDRGTHGPFDDRAHETSAQLVADEHKGALALAGAAAVAATAGAVAWLRRGE